VVQASELYDIVYVVACYAYFITSHVLVVHLLFLLLLVRVGLFLLYFAT
jgi:hypothetical protein